MDIYDGDRVSVANVLVHELVHVVRATKQQMSLGRR